MPLTSFDSTVSRKPLDFIVPDYVPAGTITLVSGEPDVGKSRLLTQVGWHLSQGQSMWWEPIAPVSVLFCSERDQREVWEQMIGLQLPNVHSVNRNFHLYSIGDQSVEEGSQFLDDPFTFLKPLVEQTGAQIVVLDTMTQFMIKRANTPNVNEYGMMVIRMRQLKQWAYRLNLGLIAIHHMRKQGPDDKATRLLDRSMGSQAIVGGSSAMWLLESTSHVQADHHVTYTTLTCRLHTRIPPAPLFLRHSCNTPYSLVSEEEAALAGLSLPLACVGSLQTSILSRCTSPQAPETLVRAVVEAEGSARQNVWRAYHSLVAQGRLSEINGTVVLARPGMIQ